MAAKKNRPKTAKTPIEPYLKIPYSPLNIRNLELCEKVLLAHIYSFGQSRKACEPLSEEEFEKRKQQLKLALLKI